MRIQAWALVRLMVTPVFRIFTGSIMRQWEMGQNNSAGGGDGPPRDPRPLLSPPACLPSCFLSPALHPSVAQHCMSPPEGAKMGTGASSASIQKACSQHHSRPGALGLTRESTCCCRLCPLRGPVAAQLAPRLWAPHPPLL